jgi:hypothetical protein
MAPDPLERVLAEHDQVGAHPRLDRARASKPITRFALRVAVMMTTPDSCAFRIAVTCFTCVRRWS